MKIPDNKTSKIEYSFLGYEKLTISVTPKNNQIRIEQNIILSKKDYTITDVVVTGERDSDLSTEKIDTKFFKVLPDISGNAVETLVKMQMGVSSSNEMSSQYNVRGGNFDENLVYVNDIQIYRPFLIRSGQQEGLSFINPNLVSNIRFSAGGFNATYGDKMSSVLDIEYKKPTEFAASISGSFLGGTAHIEGVGLNKKLTYISGVRYKQSQYFLNSLQVDGDYKPVFADFQTYLTYNVSQKFELSFLGNYAQNKYQFIPDESNERTGTLNDPIGLYINYNGMEVDKYTTYFGAFSAKYRPTRNLILKLIASSFHTQESETYDIHGRYSLYSLDNELGSETVGDTTMNIGIGEYIEHARNYLQAIVINISHKGDYTTKNNYFKWGIKYQREIINDKILEWEMIDSAGFSINSDNQSHDDYVYLSESAFAQNSLNTNRFSAFVQNNHIFDFYAFDLKLLTGVRASYWDFNNDLLLSPRISVELTPNWDKDVKFRLASGLYYQSPFYREIRDYHGNIVQDSKAQRSIHFVGGVYYNFKIWNRPFKFTSEIYFKKLDNLIPYELDNLKIRYYAHERANGYATGIDMKIYGEFVKGVDSWMSLSLMRTREDIIGDFYYEYYNDTGAVVYSRQYATDSTLITPGYIPRPSDRTVNVGLFFQDYFPGNENFKVTLGFFFSTPFPFGPPNTARYMVVTRDGKTMRSHPFYIRADLGASLLLKKEDKIFKNNKNPLKVFNTIWLSFEAFNLLGQLNTAAYHWIKIVPNTSNPVPLQYDKIAIANKLTGRLLNLKFTCTF